MQAIVLGAAAGGGFPQWNSNAPACRRARAGDQAATPRTQASLAVSADGAHWMLLNASPDLRVQIEATDELHPRQDLRHSPIGAVLLTGGDVDAIAGLLTLRERHAFTVFAAAPVIRILADNPIFGVLARDLVERRTVTLDLPFEPIPGLRAELFAVPGKVPLYLEQGAPAITADGETVGVRLQSGDGVMFYIPGCAAMSDDLARRLRGARTVFFDGTLWQDDEMIIAGTGSKTGLRMGHISVSGDHGAMAAFETLDVRRKIFVHINNSNPILLADSPERAEVERRGWTVAHDGLRVTP